MDTVSFLEVFKNDDVNETNPFFTFRCYACNYNHVRYDFDMKFVTLASAVH